MGILILVHLYLLISIQELTVFYTCMFNTLITEIMHL